MRGVWAGARMRTIGDVTETGARAPITKLSPVSRMTDAPRFEMFRTVEVSARPVAEASPVAGVRDGRTGGKGCSTSTVPTRSVSWISHTPLNGSVSSWKRSRAQDGFCLPMPSHAVFLCSTSAKTGRGPRCLGQLTRGLAETGKLREDLTSLQKREAFMPSSQSQAEGWPMGSGMVESANTLVMHACLTGAGMHWQGSPVNPMLALRSWGCNDRWSSIWEQICSQTLCQRQQQKVCWLGCAFSVHHSTALSLPWLLNLPRWWQGVRLPIIPGNDASQVDFLRVLDKKTKGRGSFFQHSDKGKRKDADTARKGETRVVPGGKR